MRTTISGIPCQAEIVYFSRGCAARTDADPGDCWESEPDDVSFKVLDRNGYAAPWLEAKLTRNDISRIECELIRSMT